MYTSDPRSEFLGATGREPEPTEADRPSRETWRTAVNSFRGGRSPGEEKEEEEEV